MPAVTAPASKLVKLFVILGVDTAPEWPTKKLQEKAEGGLKKYLEDGFEFEDTDLQDLYNSVEAANKEQEDITITEDRPEFAGKEKKPAKKEATTQPAAKPKVGKAQPAKAQPAKAAASGTSSTTKADPKPKRASTGGWKPGDPPLPFDEARGPGVLRSIRDLLMAASEKKPITKEAVVAELKKEFPDRDVAKLAVTVSNQIPSRLRIVRGLHVWRSEQGYWIPGDGSKPQPKKESVAKPKPEPKKKESPKVTTTTPKPAAKAAPKTPAKPPAKAPAKKPAAKPAKKK